MDKNELITLLSSLDIAVNEGESSTQNVDKDPRIVFWDYLWEDRIASGVQYDTIETYQISFFSKRPRHPKLIELRELLRKNGLYPIISHEFVADKKIFHSYFSIEVNV